MCKLKKGNKMLSDEVALATALEVGDVYHKYISEAIYHLESLEPDKTGKITLLRWTDIEDEVMKKQQMIFRQFYDHTSSHLKARIDKIAFEFLAYRRPQSKNHRWISDQN